MNADEFVVHVADAVARHVRTSGSPAKLQDLRLFAELLTRVANDGQERPTSFRSAIETKGPDEGVDMRLALDYPGVAAALSVSVRSARRLVESGDIPSVKIRGRRLVRRVDLVAYLAAQGAA